MSSKVEIDGESARGFVAELFELGPIGALTCVPGWRAFALCSALFYTSVLRNMASSVLRNMASSVLRQYGKQCFKKTWQSVF